MGLFNDVLGSGESLFKNEESLDPEWLPKNLPYRENQHQFIATCIKPLLMNRSGTNVFISGAPGIGKTAATRYVLRELEETTDDVIPIYVNCWQKNSSFKILIELCHVLGYKFTQNKNTEELFAIVKNMVNKKSAVFVFDEVDKIEDVDFLYSILNDVFKKSIILITNFRSWYNDVDDRIKSRLLPEIIDFKKYTNDEIRGILKQRIDYAFVPNVWDPAAVDLIAQTTANFSDVRVGLRLLREAGLIAEAASSRKINLDHAKKACEKSQHFIVHEDEIDDESRFILEIVKSNSGAKIGDVFKSYQDKGGKSAYKTFHRKIEQLERNLLVSLEKVIGGKDGSTTLVKFGHEKKLNEF